ncbi:fibronectin type iii domain-containing 3ba-related [Anaeramoeba flamelloides]|uniref:Fibronectin type iii domain-containing 3ba-related n=1 Tax=Anaeramoeba flamelloides TaxID=1746091 RepID=A0ABQ8XU15_9EUKA|nr:fibronectin type iii domain-containing 3ba-related [Anaeramoeba flamelloides]
MMICPKLFFVLLITFLALTFQTNCSTSGPKCGLVVAKTGNDTNNCEEYNNACLTIERAMGLSKGDDVICVYEGTYYLTNTISLTSQTLVSIKGSQKTIIDASSGRKCVVVEGDYSPTIDGFTFQNCQSDDTTNAGSLSFRCTTTSPKPKLQNSVIQHSTGSIAGGVYIENCGVELTNVEIENNEANSESGESSGGLYCNTNVNNHNTNLQFDNVIIVNNANPKNKFANNIGNELNCFANSNVLNNCGTCSNGGNCLPSGVCVCLPGSSIPSPDCKYCSPGSYSNSTNSKECALCDQDYYSLGEGNTKCSQCPDKTTNSGKGSSECTPTKITGGITLLSQTSTSLQFQFQLLKIPFPVLGYHVWYQRVGSAAWDIEDLLPIQNIFHLTDLLSGTYNIKMCGYNDQGDGIFSDVQQFKTLQATVPDQISKIYSIPPTTATSFQFGWGEPNNGGDLILSYELLYRQADHQEWNGINITNDSSSSTNYNLTDLLSGEYDIKMASTNAIGQSKYSLEHSFWTSNAVPPSAITNIYLNGRTSSSLTIGWDIPWNGGKQISNYELKYCPIEKKTDSCDNINWQTIDFSNPSKPVYQIKNLLSGYYIVILRAENGISPNPDFSDNFVYETKNKTLPGAVTNMQEVGFTSSSITINWDKPDQGGAKLFNYRIWYNSTYTDSNATFNFFTLSNLKSGDYEISIQAQNEVGFGNHSKKIICSTAGPQTPGKISNLKKLAGGDTFLKISWDTPQNYGETITNYQINYTCTDCDNFYFMKNMNNNKKKNKNMNNNNMNNNMDNMNNNKKKKTYQTNIKNKNQQDKFETNNINDNLIWNEIRTGNSSTNFVINNLQKKKTYDISIIAYNSVGWSSHWSDILTITTDNSTTPKKISPKPTVSGKGSTFLTIDWTNPPDGGSPLTYYWFYWKNIGINDEYISIKIDVNKLDPLQYNITKLLNGTYEVVICAENLNGLGENSNPLIVQTLPPTVPSVPIDPKQYDSTSSSVSMLWVFPESDGGSEITNFDFYFKSITREGYKKHYNTPLTFLYQASDLLSGAYNVSMASVNIVGKSDFINFQVQTEPATKPSQIEGLKAISGTSTTIIISWNKPNNNGEPLVNYLIEWKNVKDLHYQNNSFYASDAIIYQLTNLLSGDYEIKLSATNKIGTSLPSVLNTSTSAATVPAIVQDIKEKNVSSTSIQLEWKIPNNGGRKIEKYEINYFLNNDNIHDFYDYYNSNVNGNIIYSDQNSVIIENLLSGNYSIEIKAQNEIGFSKNWSQIINIATLGPIKPGKINSINSNVYRRKILFDWAQPNNGGLKILNYNITCLNEKKTYLTNNTEINFKGLVPNTNYNFLIYAINELGNGPVTVFQNKTGSPYPGTVKFCMSLQTTSISIVIQWQLYDPDPVTFNVRINNDGKTIHGINVEYLAINDLLPNVNYSIQIQAQIGEYKGNWSQMFYYKTKKYKPGQVQNIDIKSITSDSVSFSWEAPRENGYPIDDYNIQIFDQKNDNPIIKVSQNTSISVKALMANTTYYIKISAHNYEGDGPYSEKKKFSTKQNKIKKQNLGLIIGISLAVAGAVLLAGASFYYWRRRKVIKVNPNVMVYSIDGEDSSSSENIYEKQQVEEQFISNLINDTINNNKSQYYNNMENDQVDENSRLLSD